jgi:hypothetical protein
MSPDYRFPNRTRAKGDRVLITLILLATAIACLVLWFR